jgi:Amt family ammonium transporter
MPFPISQISAGDTAWVLASCALVLLMTPGLAFFYGGMVRAKNVLGMLMQNYAAIMVVSVLWVVVGFSLAFGEQGNGHGGSLQRFIGNFHFYGLHHMEQVIPGFSTATIPPLAFVIFQLMFAIITPALITGSIADRAKFGTWVVFCGLWSLLVYSPVAHWVFSPTGYLFGKGAEDFAGGTVVHINAGIAGVALAIVLGKRKGWPKEQMKPHNLPFTMLGAALLWFGWFGFNAGSALGANTLASYAFINTNTATATAMAGWLLVEKLRDGHATSLGAASGAVAGLVAITPAAGFVTPLGSAALGLIAGIICAFAVTLKYKVGLDDSLDVAGVHLIGGIAGSLMVGFFGDKHVSGVNGLFHGGGWHLFNMQALAVGMVLVYSFTVSLVLGFILHKTMGFRISEEAEVEGMDSSIHAETAYETPATVGLGRMVG